MRRKEKEEEEEEEEGWSERGGLMEDKAGSEWQTETSQ